MAASQLHVLTNENAELASRSQQNAYIKKKEHHIVLLSEPTVYSLYCDLGPGFVCVGGRERGKVGR